MSKVIVGIVQGVLYDLHGSPHLRFQSTFDFGSGPGSVSQIVRFEQFVVMEITIPCVGIHSHFVTSVFDCHPIDDQSSHSLLLLSEMIVSSRSTFRQSKMPLHCSGHRFWIIFCQPWESMDFHFLALLSPSVELLFSKDKSFL